MIPLLYVDDEPGLLEIAKIFLEKDGEFSVTTSLSGEEALPLIQSASFAAIISDYMMPSMDGISFLKAVRQQYPDIPFILFTGRGREEIVIEAINNGADFYLQKGGDPKAQFAELVHKVRQAIARRNAERSLVESEKRLADIINFLPDATFAIDKAGRVIAWNRAIEEMTGVAASGMIGKGDYEYAIPFYGSRRKILIDLIFESDDVIARQYANVIRKKDTLIADTSLPRPRGRAVTLMGIAGPLYDRRGEIIGAIESIRDITDVKKAEEELRAAYGQLQASEEQLRVQFAELARSEQRIRESEEKFRELAELLPQIVFEIDTGFRVTFVNRKAYAMLGFTPEDVGKGFNALSLFSPAERERAVESIRKLSSGVEYEHTEYNLIRKDGTTFPALIYADPFTRGGTLAGFRGIIIDISERKEAEAALRESEEKHRMLVEVNRDIIFSLDPRGNVLYVSPQTTSQLGYPPEELLGKNFTQIVHPDDIPVLARHIREHDGPGSAIFSDQFRLRRKDGTYRWFEDKSIYTPDHQGRNIIIGTIRDITDQKKAEDEIRERGAVLAGILRAVPVGIGFLSGRTIVHVNDLFCRMTGYSYDESVGRDTRFLYPDDDEYTRVGKLQLGGEDPGLVRKTETRWKRKDGTIRDILLSGVALDPADPAAGRVYTALDITEEKRSQEDLKAAYEKISASEEELRDQYNELARSQQRLQESEAKYRAVVEQSRDAIFIAQNGVLVFHNPSFESLTGWSGAGLAGRSIADLIAPEDREMVTARHQERLKGHALPEVYEFSVLHHDGTTRIRVVMNVTSGTYGGMPATIGTLHNVTEERKREELLRESEAKFRAVIDQSFGFIGLLTPDGMLITANRAALAFAGLSEADVINRPFWETPWWTHSAALQERLKDAIRRAAIGETLRFEATHTAADGHLATIDFSIKPVVDPAGRIQYLVPEGRDITDRKKAEQALIESEERLQLALDGGGLGTWNWDVQTGSVIFNRRWVEMLGYRPDEVEPHVRSWERLVHPDDMPRVQETLNAHLEGRTDTYECEHRLRHKDGSWVWVLDKGRVITRDPDGKPRIAAGTHLDITERKRAEERLRESEERYRIFVETANEGIWAIDAEFRTTFTNRKMEEMFGYRAEEMLGRPVWDFVPPEDAESIRQVLLERRTGKPGRYERRWVRKDGAIVWCLTSATPLFSQDGRFLGSFGMFTDVTKQRQSEAKARTLIEMTGTGFVVLDGAGRVLDANPAYVRLTGRAGLDEIVGRSVVEWTADPEKEKNAAAVRKCLQEGSIRNFEIDYAGPSGKITPVEINATVLREGDTEQILTLCRDISERRKLQEYRNRLSTLKEDLIGAAPVEKKLKRITDSVVEIFGADFARIWMTAEGDLCGLGCVHAPVTDGPHACRDRTSCLHLVASSGRYTHADGGHRRVPLACYKIGRIATGEDEFFITNDVTNDPQVHDHAWAASLGLVSFAGFRLVSETGKPIGVLAFFSRQPVPPDLTDLFRDLAATASQVIRTGLVETTLADSEERFRRLIANSFDAVVVHQDGAIVLANDRAVQIIGAPSTTDLIGKPVGGLVHPEYRSTVAARIQDLLRSPGGTAPLIEEKFIRLDGSPVDVEVMATMMTHGGRPAVMVVFRDISDRKRTEAELRSAYENLTASDEELRSQVEELARSHALLRESEDRYRKIIDTTSEWIWETDLTGRHTYTNPAVKTLLGYEPAEFLGSDTFLLMHPDDQETIKVLFQSSVQEKKGWRNLVIRWRHRDGTYRYLESNATPVFDRDGVLTGFHGADRDVTDRKLLEQAIRQSNRKLSLLASITRHDMVNQLTLLQGYLQIAAIKKPDKATGALLTKVQAAVETISRQLDFMKTYQELGMKDPGWFRIEEVIAKVRTPIVTVSGTCGAAEIFADPLIEKVFYNLFDNAARHGGRVTEISIRCSKGGNGLVITVEDNGDGIPEREKEKIFSKGYGKHTGLGLFLAREILSLTRITIRETGVFGSGARFEIVVPEGSYRFL